MRIGTWNLDLKSDSPTDGWTEKADWMGGQQVGLWLLTEAHHLWDSRGKHFLPSPERSIQAEKGRWAAIQSSWSLTQLHPRTDRQHSGDEGLALARVDLDDGPVLVACSVLPWNGAREFWGGLPDAAAFDQFRCVLDRHVARIITERKVAEPLIWGGDFNQPLIPPFSGGSKDQALVLRSALDYLGLTSLTQSLAHRNGQMFAVDHLAVSADFLAERVEVHRPTRADGSNMSDHAAYVAEIHRAGNGPDCTAESGPGS